VPFSRGLSIEGSVRPDATEIQGDVFVTGWTLLHEGASVDVRFADGEDATVPLTWVSAPIDAGFFLYEVPKEHRSRGHSPTALVLNDASGHAIREVSIPSIFHFLSSQ